MAPKSTKTPEAAPVVAEPMAQAPELHTIEELQKKNSIKRAVFAGACAANSWKPGKQLTKEEFLTAINKFTGAPMHGDKSRKKEAKG